MNKIFLVVFAFGCVVSLIANAQQKSGTPQQERNCMEADAQGRCTRYQVSMIELIGNPEKYDGKKIQVFGFLHLEMEGNGLYLSKTDLDHRLYKNGLWFDQSGQKDVSKLSDKYVLIEATFNAKNPGHLGLWSGAVEKVTRLEEWK